MLFQLPKFVENRYRVPHQSTFIMSCMASVITSRGPFSVDLKFLCILKMEVENAFALNYLFKDVCIAISLGKEREHFPQEQKASMLIAHYERFESPKHRVPLLNATHIGCGYIVFFEVCCRCQGLGNRCL